MRSVPSRSQLKLNSGKPGPKRARSRAYARAGVAARLDRLIDALIVRLTMKGINPRVVAAMLGLDPPVVARRLKRIPAARRKRYETQSLAELANIPPDWDAKRLPRLFMA